jgi:SseB protein N-terminal domain
VTRHLKPGAELKPGGQQFRGDDGAADPAVTAALAAYTGHGGTERSVLEALTASRLLVPVIAMLTEADDSVAGQSVAGQSGAGQSGADKSGADKSSEMVLPTLIGQDGRPAIIAFTCMEALTRWRPDARPIPVEAARVWQAGVTEADAVAIDIAGPVPIIVERARLAALAAGQPPPLPHEDPDVQREVDAAIAGEPQITGSRLAPGRPEVGTHVTVELLVAPDADEDMLRRVAADVSARLGNRMALEVIAQF